MFESWLDLGAGDGGALMRGVKPLAKEISTTEICPVMRKRLEWRGFGVEDVNLWKSKKWKIISMLNLLDRAGNPDDFLENATAAVEDGETFVICPQKISPKNKFFKKSPKNKFFKKVRNINSSKKSET